MNRTIFVICLFTLICFVGFSATRIPLVERFTNTSCGYCPPCGTTINNLSSTYGANLSIVEIHVNWPSSSDPYYVYCPLDMYSRWGHYGVSGVPDVAVDGKKLGGCSTVSTEVSSRTGVSSPLSITITTGESIRVDVNVETSTAGTNNRLFAAITQSNNYWGSAPNGEYTSHNVLRTILPYPLGQLIDLTVPGVRTFYFYYNWDASTWNSANMKVVAWVQNMSSAVTSYNVYNSKWVALPQQNHHFRFNPGTRSRFVSRDTTATMGGGYLRNTGSVSDTYMLKMVKSLPAGWTANLVIGSTSSPDSTTTTLSAGDSTRISVVFNTVGRGLGIVDLVYRSHGNGFSDTVRYTVGQNVDILLVDDDAGAMYEYYYESTLDRLGEVYFTAHRSEGYFTGSYLQTFPIVIWFTGQDYTGVLNTNDTLAIRQYLNAGGKLFMSSQELGYYCMEYLTTPWTNFYRTWFKATYVNDTTGLRSIRGTPGGPFAGLTYSIFGGDGAGITPYPDKITAYGGGQTAIDYNGGTFPTGGVVFAGTYRLVYFAFPWEVLSSPIARDTMMARTLFYLRHGYVDVEETPKIPEEFAVMSIAPNPFNPTTQISLDVNEPCLNARLEIFDISGRKVKTLLHGPIEKGKKSVFFDGRDELGRALPSGVYLVRFVNGENVIMKKLLMGK